MIEEWAFKNSRSGKGQNDIQKMLIAKNNHLKDVTSQIAKN